MCACWGGLHAVLGSKDLLKRKEGRDGCKMHMLVIGHMEMAGRSHLGMDIVELWSGDSLLNLTGIHPGRGAEEQCRKATVIYEQEKQPRCSKNYVSYTLYVTDIKGESHPQIHSHSVLSAYVYLDDEALSFVLPLFSVLLCQFACNFVRLIFIFHLLNPAEIYISNSISDSITCNGMRKGGRTF